MAKNGFYLSQYKARSEINPPKRVTGARHHP